MALRVGGSGQNCNIYDVLLLLSRLKVDASNDHVLRCFLCAGIVDFAFRTALPCASRYYNSILSWFMCCDCSRIQNCLWKFHVLFGVAEPSEILAINTWYVSPGPEINNNTSLAFACVAFNLKLGSCIEPGTWSPALLAIRPFVNKQASVEWVLRTSFSQKCNTIHIYVLIFVFDWSWFIGSLNLPFRTVSFLKQTRQGSVYPYVLCVVRTTKKVPMPSILFLMLFVLAWSPPTTISVQYILHYDNNEDLFEYE